MLYACEIGKKVIKKERIERERERGGTLYFLTHLSRERIDVGLFEETQIHVLNLRVPKDVKRLLSSRNGTSGEKDIEHDTLFVKSVMFSP